MASRPVFLPSEDRSRLVKEVSFDFPWSSGFAEVQKRKNIAALHRAAMEQGIDYILEISSKSELEIGRRLSAFSLKLEIEGENFPLESVYQSSKVFRTSGPFPEVLRMSPRDAKRYVREHASGNLVAFKLGDDEFPLSPKNAFYDWLYIRALAPFEEWITEKVKFRAFTDIEFNPQKQVNCQARAFAEFLSLAERSEVQRASRSFSYFASLLSPV